MQSAPSEIPQNIIPKNSVGIKLIFRFFTVNAIALVLGIMVVNLLRLLNPIPESISASVNQATFTIEEMAETETNLDNEEMLQKLGVQPAQPESSTSPSVAIEKKRHSDQFGVDFSKLGIVDTDSAGFDVLDEPAPSPLADDNLLSAPAQETETSQQNQSFSLLRLFNREPPIVSQTNENASSIPPIISANNSTRRLILPSVGISTEVIDVHILNGDWDISEVDVEVGQLDGFAAHPDDPGPIVLAAHATLNWPQKGPFNKLRNSNIGETIIYRVDDVEYIYTITRFLKVNTSDVSRLNKDGEDGIVLVTCGAYNFFTGVYGKRLIVYGTLLEVREAPAPKSLD